MIEMICIVLFALPVLKWVLIIGAIWAVVSELWECYGNGGIEK